MNTTGRLPMPAATSFSNSMALTSCGFKTMKCILFFLTKVTVKCIIHLMSLNCMHNRLKNQMNNKTCKGLCTNNTLQNEETHSNNKTFRYFPKLSQHSLYTGKFVVLSLTTFFYIFRHQFPFYVIIAPSVTGVIMMFNMYPARNQKWTSDLIEG